MPSILIICTANQCRSPMAMVLLHQRLKELDLEEEWVVGSAGTWGFEGVPATDNAIQAMRETGLDLEGHRSRKATEEILSQSDLVLTMERYHKEALQVEFPEQADKVYMLSEMVDEGYDIKDPVEHPLEDYLTTAALIDGILGEGMDRILQLARSNAAARAEGR